MVTEVMSLTYSTSNLNLNVDISDVFIQSSYKVSNYYDKRSLVPQIGGISSVIANMIVPTLTCIVVCPVCEAWGDPE